MNEFTPLTKQEKRELNLKKEKALAARNQAIQAAKECLAHEKFQKYKEKYEEAKEATISYLLELREPDPIKFAFEARGIIEKLRSVGTLLYQVKKEAGNK